jgi:hypothetical protein
MQKWTGELTAMQIASPGLGPGEMFRNGIVVADGLVLPASGISFGICLNCRG